MNYLIGIDGGATKSKCVITDFALNVIHTCQSGPSNLLASNVQDAAKNISLAVFECLENLVISSSDIASIVIGSAGAGRSEDAELLKKSFIRILESQNKNINSIHVVSDAEIALEGAFSGEPGIILIAGTGSICYGKDSAENIARVGGYGRLLGDEGSGFSIGVKALKLALKNYDGRADCELLKKKLFAKLEANSPSDVITKVYNQKYHIPDLALVVIDAAEKGDSSALQILGEESEELIDHLTAMISKLSLQKSKVALLGSVISNENIFASILREKIQKHHKELYLQDPDYPPEIGAVMMAKKRLGFLD